MRSLPHPYPAFTPFRRLAALFRTLLACILLLYASRARAQQQYLFSHLGTKDGLASNITTAVEQDHKGFLWLGTMGGIERYDGQRLMLFRHKQDDPHSIPNDNVFAIRLDHHHRLWVLCQYNKIGYIDLDDLQYHPVQVDMPAGDLARLEGNLNIDYQGHVLLFFKRSYPVAYDDSVRAFTRASVPFEVPANWLSYNMLEDSVSHTYYIGTDSGLVKYDPAHHTMSYRGHNPDHDPVIHRYGHLTYIVPHLLDRSGRIWLATWPPSGAFIFYSYNPKTDKEQTWQAQISRALHGQYFEMNMAYEQKDSTIWMTGLNTLIVLRKNSKEFENLKTNTANEFGIYFDIINFLREDREGNIWLASDKGLYRFNPSEQRFRTIVNRRPDKDSVYTPDVTDIKQIMNGDILVSTWGSGIFVYDSTFHPVDRWYARQARRFYQGGTWCIYQRSNGDIWTGEQAGNIVIAHLTARTSERLTPPALENSTVRQITGDKNGDLWLGTQRGKLVKWSAATNTFSIIQDLHSRVYRLYIDKKGDLWVCTMQSGLFHIRISDGAILHKYTADGPENQRLPDMGTSDIVQYSDSVYAVISNTLCFLNIHTGAITIAEHADGIPFEGATNVVRDKLGYLWITTRDGLCKTNLHNQIRNVFREEDGISSNTFQLASSGTLADGRIAFGTSHDVIVFQPGNIGGGERRPPDVEITNIAVANKWLSMDSVNRLSELELPYGDNGIRIAFSTLTYFSAFGIAYKMENLDKDWVSGMAGEAVYNYLPPGHYVFQVQARDADDHASPHIREFHIKVKSPFWRTWWFLGFLLLAAATVLYLLDRLRMQRRADMENIRSNISGGLHEEVNKALQNINVLSEIARIKADKDPEQSINYINEIHAQSHNMIIAMDDMLWSIDPANDSMDRAIDRMKEFAGALSRRHGARIGLEADDAIRVLRPDMNIRHEFLLIYKLALRLLVEEMKVAGVLVQLDYQRPHFHLTMFAAGARMDDRNSRSIRLLEEMKTRARNIHGTLEMQYDEKGTAILFICPSTF